MSFGTSKQPFGLILPKSKQQVAAKGPLRNSNVAKLFEDALEADEEQIEQITKGGVYRAIQATSNKHAGSLSKEAAVDPSVFGYDEVFDTISTTAASAAERARRKEEVMENGGNMRKPSRCVTFLVMFSFASSLKLFSCVYPMHLNDVATKDFKYMRLYTNAGMSKF